MRSKQQITAVLHLPESEQGRKLFQKKMRDFYISQVEKKILSCDLTKEERIKIITELINGH